MVGGAPPGVEADRVRVYVVGSGAGLWGGGVFVLQPTGKNSASTSNRVSHNSRNCPDPIRSPMLGARATSFFSVAQALLPASFYYAAISSELGLRTTSHPDKRKKTGLPH